MATGWNVNFDFLSQNQEEEARRQQEEQEYFNNLRKVFAEHEDDFNIAWDNEDEADDHNESSSSIGRAPNTAGNNNNHDSSSSHSKSYTNGVSSDHDEAALIVQANSASSFRSENRTENEETDLDIEEDEESENLHPTTATCQQPLPAPFLHLAPSAMLTAMGGNPDAPFLSSDPGTSISWELSCPGELLQQVLPPPSVLPLNLYQPRPSPYPHEPGLRTSPRKVVTRDVGVEAIPEGQRDLDQLQLLYHARGRRIEELQSALRTKEEDLGKEVRILHHKLTLLEGERNHTHSQWRAAQDEVEKLREEVRQFRVQMHSLQEAESQSRQEIDRWRHKYTLLESTKEDLQSQLVTLTTSAAQTKAREEQHLLEQALRQRHGEELLELRQAVDKCRHEIQRKDEEVASLRDKLQQKVRRQSQMHYEHAQAMDGLTQQLQESQKRCQELATSNAVDLARELRVELREVHRAKDVVDHVNQALHSENHQLKEHLSMLESAMQFGVSLSPDTPERGRDQHSSRVPGGMLDFYNATLLRDTPVRERDRGGTRAVSFEEDRVLTDVSSRSLPSTVTLGERPSTTPPTLSNSNSILSSHSQQVSVRQLRSELERCLTNYRHRATECGQLRQELLHATEEATLARKCADVADKALLEAKERMFTLEEKLRDLETQRPSQREQHLSSELQRFKEMNGRLEDELQKLRTTWDEMSSQNEQMTKVNVELRAQVEHLVKDAEEERSRMWNQLQEESHSLIQEQLAQSAKEVDEIKRVYVALCQEKNELETLLMKEKEEALLRQEKELRTVWQREQHIQLEEKGRALEEEWSQRCAALENDLRTELRTEREKVERLQVNLETSQQREEVARRQWETEVERLHAELATHKMEAESGKLKKMHIQKTPVSNRSIQTEPLECLSSTSLLSPESPSLRQLKSHMEQQFQVKFLSLKQEKSEECWNEAWHEISKQIQPLSRALNSRLGLSSWPEDNEITPEIVQRRITELIVRSHAELVHVDAQLTLTREHAVKDKEMFRTELADVERRLVQDRTEAAHELATLRKQLQKHTDRTSSSLRSRLKMYSVGSQTDLSQATCLPPSGNGLKLSTSSSSDAASFHSVMSTEAIPPSAPPGPSNTEDLQSLREHCLQAMSLMKDDVMTFIVETQTRTAEVLKKEVVKSQRVARRKFASELRKALLLYEDDASQQRRDEEECARDRRRGGVPQTQHNLHSSWNTDCLLHLVDSICSLDGKESCASREETDHSLLWRRRSLDEDEEQTEAPKRSVTGHQPHGDSPSHSSGSSEHSRHHRPFSTPPQLLRSPLSSVSTSSKVPQVPSPKQGSALPHQHRIYSTPANHQRTPPLIRSSTLPSKVVAQDLFPTRNHSPKY